MIPFNFSYQRPKTANEAVNLFKKADMQGMNPIFYSGGTEIISRARNNGLHFGTVIDIKGIQECRSHQMENDQLITGAAVTLSEVDENNAFPLLQKTVKQIATRNARNKITVGGNILSSLPYKEALLPFLATDSTAVIAGKSGTREVKVSELLKEGLVRGELLLQLRTDVQWMKFDYFVKKKTRQSAVNYPLHTLCAVKKADHISLAICGSVSSPTQSKKLDAVLNNKALSVAEKLDGAVKQLSGNIMNDFQASAAYRQFLIKETFNTMLKYFEGVS